MMVARRDQPEEGFLHRWSRRKREQEQPVEPVAVAAEPEDDAEAPDAEPSEEEILANLPDIDTLGPGSDFKPFMQAAVPAGMKRLALRKLWASNPLYNRIDMLDDYCEDYTDKATVVEGLKTAYRVGQGMVKKLDELAGTQGDEASDNQPPHQQAELNSEEDSDGSIPVADSANRS